MKRYRFKIGGVKCQAEMEQNLLAKEWEEAAAGVAWVEIVQGQALEATAFVRVADRELLISGEYRAIQQIARNAGQRW